MTTAPKRGLIVSLSELDGEFYKINTPNNPMSAQLSDRQTKNVPPIQPVIVLALQLVLCAAAAWMILRHNWSIWWLGVPGVLILFAVPLIPLRTALALEILGGGAGLLTIASLPQPSWCEFAVVGLSTLALIPLIIRIHALNSRRAGAEQALEYSLERVRHAFEGTEDGFWDWRLDRREMYLSPGFGDLMEREALADLKVSTLRRIVHPDDLEDLIRQFKAHYAGERAQIRGEFRVKDREGKWKWVVLKGKITGYDANHKPARITGTVFDIAEQKKAEQNLKESEMIFRQVAGNIREVFWLRDRETRRLIYMRLDENIKNMEATNNEVRFKSTDYYYENIHPDDRERIRKSENDLYEKGIPFHEEYRFRHHDGTMRWLSCRQHPVLDEEGVFYRVLGVAEDITERKHAGLALQQSEKRFRDMVERQREGVIIVDTEEVFVYTNPAAGEILGMPHESLIGRRWDEFLDAKQLDVLLSQTANRRQGIESSYELVIQRPNGQKRNILCTAAPRWDENEQFIGGMGVIRDITEHRNEMEHLRYLSSHDPLTGIHNRAYFEEKLQKLENSGQYPTAVIMIDVDNLKKINDNWGHAVGDQLLTRTARLLKRSLREGDLTARIGGDEFAILMPKTDQKTLDGIIQRLREQVALENEQLGPGCQPIEISIGGSVQEKPGSLKDALKQADVRMYLDKARTRPERQG